VFHLAAVADVDRAAKDPLGTIDTNVSGTGVVLEAARQAGVGRVILASTVWVYAAAPGEGEIPEDAPIDPTRVSHVYTATKLAAEMLVHSYHELYGLDFTILRYGIPYGPGMRDELVIARFLNQALSGQPITIAGDGSQYRKYVYVGDLAEAHVLALDERAANQVIALDGSEQVSIRRIAEDVRTLVGDVTVTFTEKRAGDFAGREIATWKAESLLGWRPLTTFSDGLGRCLEWYRSRASAP
jgi:UDP-glucose 4-epimerase